MAAAPASGRESRPFRTSSTMITSVIAKAIAADLIDAYQRLELDHVYLLYNEFKSVIQQRVVIERLLPIERTLLDASEPALDYLYEPAPAEILAR